MSIYFIKSTNWIELILDLIWPVVLARINIFGATVLFSYRWMTRQRKQQFGFGGQNKRKLYLAEYVVLLLGQGSGMLYHGLHDFSLSWNDRTYQEQGQKTVKEKIWDKQSKGITAIERSDYRKSASSSQVMGRRIEVTASELPIVLYIV